VSQSSSAPRLATHHEGGADQNHHRLSAVQPEKTPSHTNRQDSRRYIIAPVISAASLASRHRYNKQYVLFQTEPSFHLLSTAVLPARQSVDSITAGSAANIAYCVKSATRQHSQKYRRLLPLVQPQHSTSWHKLWSLCVRAGKHQAPRCSVTSLSRPCHHGRHSSSCQHLGPALAPS